MEAVAIAVAALVVAALKLVWLVTHGLVARKAARDRQDDVARAEWQRIRQRAHQRRTEREARERRQRRGRTRLRVYQLRHDGRHPAA